MDLRLVTVTFDAEAGAFPAEPLVDVPGEIVSVVEHFFFYDGLPRLLLVVQLRSPEEGTGARAKGQGTPKAGLDDGPAGSGGRRPEQGPALRAGPAQGGGRVATV